jgi:hypothetical protein
MFFSCRFSRFLGGLISAFSLLAVSDNAKAAPIRYEWVQVTAPFYPENINLPVRGTSRGYLVIDSAFTAGTYAFDSRTGTPSALPLSPIYTSITQRSSVPIIDFYFYAEVGYTTGGVIANALALLPEFDPSVTYSPERQTYFDSYFRTPVNPTEAYGSFVVGNDGTLALNGRFVLWQGINVARVDFFGLPNGLTEIGPNGSSGAPLVGLNSKPTGFWRIAGTSATPSGFSAIPAPASITLLGLGLLLCAGLTRSKK